MSKAHIPLSVGHNHPSIHPFTRQLLCAFTETRPTVIWVAKAIIIVCISHPGVRALHGVGVLWKVEGEDFARRLMCRVTNLSWFAKDKSGLS